VFHRFLKMDDDVRVAALGLEAGFGVCDKVELPGTGGERKVALVIGEEICGWFERLLVV